MLLLPVIVSPDTAHINTAWQGVGMDSRVLLHCAIAIAYMSHCSDDMLPHAWLFIHDDSM